MKKRTIWVRDCCRADEQAEHRPEITTNPILSIRPPASSFVKNFRGIWGFHVRASHALVIPKVRSFTNAPPSDDSAQNGRFSG